MISSVGASKNAKRAAVIHLSFNVIATLIILPLYYLISWFLQDPLGAQTVGEAVLPYHFRIQKK